MPKDGACGSVGRDACHRQTDSCPYKASTYNCRGPHKLYILALPGPDLSRAGLGTDNSGAVARRKPIGDSKSRQLLRQSIVTADGMSMSKRRQKGTHAQRIRRKGSALCPYPFPYYPYYPYYPLPIPSPNRGLTHRMLLTPAIGT